MSYNLTNILAKRPTKEVYRDGEIKYYKLKDAKLDIKAAPGEASFVIPF